MRRKIPLPEADKVFPIMSWEVCHLCMCQFRFERGYKVWVGPSGPYDFGYYIYYCSGCAGSPQDAYVMISEEVKRDREGIPKSTLRPESPTPPPPRSVTGKIL
jgi:hypothetical protein